MQKSLLFSNELIITVVVALRAIITFWNFYDIYVIRIMHGCWWL